VAEQGGGSSTDLHRDRPRYIRTRSRGRLTSIRGQWRRAIQKQPPTGRVWPHWRPEFGNLAPRCRSQGQVDEL